MTWTRVAAGLLMACAGAWAAEPGITPADAIRGALAKPPTRSLNTRQIDVRPAISLSVTFGLNSAALTPQGAAQLDELARALQSPELAQKRYAIDGYTDAKGNAKYNLKLSARRAAAAKAYLVSTYGIPEDRLVTHGYGGTKLANPNDPFDAANRRVEILELP